MTTYHTLAHHPREEDLRKLRLTYENIGTNGDVGVVGVNRGGRTRQIMAKKCGEFRPPRKGEWYLSGAIPQAWLAVNDLTTSYHILELVIVREKTTYTEEKIEPTAGS